MIRKLILVLTLAALPLAASAAPNGLAWDSVTKLAMTADSSTLQPGSFDADYAAAAAVQAPMQPPTAMQSVQRMMKTGLAQRHYVAASKERIDDIAQQTATIVDCDARTITTLDLRRKTYHVVSMDQAAQTSGPGGEPLSRFLKNGTSVAISATNTALGALVVDGQPSNGFRSQMTITQTSASGEAHTVNAVRVAYYSAYRNPASACSGVAMAASFGPGVMGIYDQLMSAVSSGGTNLHLSFNQNGPLLPTGKVTMYEAMTFGMQGHGATFTIERGNIRPISADDPVFGIPQGFTAQQ